MCGLIKSGPQTAVQSRVATLASFPGLPRLRFLIAAIKNRSRGRPGNEAMATPRFSNVPRPHRKSLGTKLGCGIVSYPGVNERAGYEVVELVESGIIYYVYTLPGGVAIVILKNKTSAVLLNVRTHSGALRGNSPHCISKRLRIAVDHEW